MEGRSAFCPARARPSRPRRASSPNQHAGVGISVINLCGVNDERAFVCPARARPSRPWRASGPNHHAVVNFAIINLVQVNDLSDSMEGGAMEGKGMEVLSFGGGM